MEENNVVVENGTVENDNEKLTTGEKVILGVTAGVLMAAGYFTVKHIVIPVGRKIGGFFGSKKENLDQKRGKKSKSGVPYDEDGDFTEVNGDEEED